MNSVERKSTLIVNEKGLHARASAKVARLALTLPVQVTIAHDGESADARSIMDLLCLGAAQGRKVELSAEGDGARQALEAVSALFAEGFGELDGDSA
jgi:phosphocarrier protein